MPNSYPFSPAYDERQRAMTKWKLQGSALIEDPEQVDEPEVDDGFDPSDHTIDEVKAHVDEHPEDRDAVLAAEQAGKARVTLVEWLES